MIGREFAGYKIEAQIGQGGIGVVYRAIDRRLGREVALKLLRVDVVAPAQRPRFEREAKTLASLSHPNIVTILDCGVAEDIPFLAMELLEGQSLADALAAQRFAAARVEHVIRELIAALAYVHERGLVHRDLKPGNVLLQRLVDGGERVKLLDFGLAKVLEADGNESPLTRTGEVFGTPAYMPPEQWSGDRVDARADVYSAAVVCFEIVTGRRPFLGDGQGLLRAQLIETPPLVHEACPARVASPELERFLQHALAKMPRDRQPSAVDLASELEAMPRPWLYEGTDATNERRSAAAAARDALDIATAPTLEQPVPEEIEAVLARAPVVGTATAGAAKRGLRRPHKPSVLSRVLRHVALLGAWTLSFASLVVIGVAATMIYLSRDAEHTEARDAIKQALPPLRDAVTHAAANAKAVVSDVVSSAARQVTEPVPFKAEAAETAPPAEAERPVSARKPARNPWRSPTPAALRKLRTQIEAGQRGTDRMLAELRRYNRDQPEDPRSHLLLARLFVNRGVWSEAASHYKLAFERDPSSRGDPRMLRDLVASASREASAARARELIPAIYGDEALPAIERARTRTRGADERARLDRLIRAISP